MKNLAEYEIQFESRIEQIALSDDPAHDLLHFKRVVKTAKALAVAEGANLNIVVPAAWLHDFVIIPKNDSRRSQASRLSAQAALKYLSELGYDVELLEGISHAIESHSFSANITPRTLEAKVVQDADRLDGLGAIGVARCFATGSIMERPFYSEADPFCHERLPDDQAFTIDHFFAKLFKTAETLKTESGRTEGLKRAETMRMYLNDLEKEI